MEKNIVLKSIILSLLTISLAACGGGGGGGGGSSGGGAPTPPPLIPEDIIIDKPIELEKGQGFNGTSNTKIILKGKKGENITGIRGDSGNIENRGSIEIENETEKGKSLGKLIGIKSINSEIKNTGIIRIKGYSDIIGIDSERGIVRNSNEININSLEKNTISIGVNSSNGKVHNTGKILIESKGKATGIVGINGSEIFNTGEIILNSQGKDNIGIKVSSNSSGYSSGEITINGHGYGMYAEGNAKIINYGIININDQGYGMYAKDGAYALNDENGVINLSSQAQGGMVADGIGSVVENKGTINVDSGSSLTKDKVVRAINGGVVKNFGNIVFKDKATIYSVGGTYTIGTSQDGSYGKITAENIEIDGNVAIDSGITKGSYKDSYTLDGVFEGSVEFGEGYKVLSASLLYDAEIYQGKDGNYDGRLERNDKVISDFTTGDYIQTAKLFDKYFSENEYNNLSEAGKNLIDSINIEDEKILRENIKDLTPTLYANNSRIISEIGDSFKEQREKTISSLGEYDYNFSFIGKYGDVDSENIVEGYESQMTGFVGSMRLSDENYLSLGYGYSDIDYDGDSEGNIHSIHLGIDSYKKYGDLNLQYGIGGEYNFHEIDREKRSYNTKGESDFDSYGVKAYGKISKEYNSIIEVEPFISLDLGYYHVDSISEKSTINGKEQKINISQEDYLSLREEIGIKLAKKFNNLKIYGGVSYSYELGDTDKRVDYSYEGIVGKNEIRDNQESGLLTTKVGVDFIKNSFTFGLEGGKNFGKRDNSFVSGSIGYIF